jgi:hypothetical protein
MGLDNEGLQRCFGDDFRRVFPIYAGPQFNLSPGATSRTPFGIEREGLGYGQPLSHPSAKATIAEVPAYPWPELQWMDVSHIRAAANE